ncbi:MAG: RecX family transcriptional regulator, partial [Anaeroplasmataceae bacterium]|nr:RecX family transcriptional regulator [Anaeroplasmataceae bacterium]
LENNAINYALRYGKSSLEVARYLEKKDVSKDLARQIVSCLVEKKIINDLDLAKNMASFLARSSNGPIMIKTKLIGHLFSEEIIEIALHSIGEDDYQIGYDKLEKKASMKFAKLNDYERKMKMREYFYRHGYFSN